MSKKKGKVTDTFLAESLCYVQVCDALVWSSSKILLYISDNSCFVRFPYLQSNTDLFKAEYPEHTMLSELRDL